MNWVNLFRDRSQKLVRKGLGAKSGALKFLTLVRGALKITKFPVKIEFSCISMGWPIIFMAKRGLKFFEVWRGGGEISTLFFFLHQAPLSSVCEWSLTTMFYSFPYLTQHILLLFAKWFDKFLQYLPADTSRHSKKLNFRSKSNFVIYIYEQFIKVVLVKS